jgi:hypothetical protein
MSFLTPKEINGNTITFVNEKNQVLILENNEHFKYLRYGECYKLNQILNPGNNPVNINDYLNKDLFEFVNLLEYDTSKLDLPFSPGAFLHEEAVVYEFNEYLKQLDGTKFDLVSGLTWERVLREIPGNCSETANEQIKNNELRWKLYRKHPSLISPPQKPGSWLRILREEQEWTRIFKLFTEESIAQALYKNDLILSSALLEYIHNNGKWTHLSLILAQLFNKKLPLKSLILNHHYLPEEYLLSEIDLYDNSDSLIRTYSAVNDFEINSIITAFLQLKVVELWRMNPNYTISGIIEAYKALFGHTGFLELLIQKPSYNERAQDCLYFLKDNT